MHVSAASFSFKAQVGNAYTVGARDEEKRPTGTAGRLDRALRNFLETFPIFAALILIVHLAGEQGAWSLWGAWIYLAGRTIYLPLYAAGIPWLRTFSWNVATAGLAMTGLELIL